MENDHIMTGRDNQTFHMHIIESIEVLKSKARYQYTLKHTIAFDVEAIKTLSTNQFVQFAFLNVQGLEEQTEHQVQVFWSCCHQWHEA